MFLGKPFTTCIDTSAINCYEKWRKMVAETVAKNKSTPVVYKKSHCTLEALMTQIETYCGCFISYMNDIERYINTTRNTKRMYVPLYTFDYQTVFKRVTFTNMECVLDSFLVDSNGNVRNTVSQRVTLLITILTTFTWVYYLVEKNSKLW